MKIIDLTHTFDENMPVYPGDPSSTLKQVASIEKDTYNDEEVKTVMHVGTHMDAPLHMIEGGKRIDEVSPDRLIGRGVAIDARGKEALDAIIINKKVEEGDVVLLYSGFGSKYRDKSYFDGYPHLTEDFAQKIVELKVKMVGMDFLGPDLDKPWLTHKVLLGNGILILENLTNLDQLLNEESFEIIALPAKFKANAAPVRVVAKVN